MAEGHWVSQVVKKEIPDSDEEASEKLKEIWKTIQ